MIEFKVFRKNISSYKVPKKANVFNLQKWGVLTTRQKLNEKYVGERYLISDLMVHAQNVLKEVIIDEMYNE